MAGVGEDGDLPPWPRRNGMGPGGLNTTKHTALETPALWPPCIISSIRNGPTSHPGQVQLVRPPPGVAGTPEARQTGLQGAAALSPLTSGLRFFVRRQKLCPSSSFSPGSELGRRWKQVERKAALLRTPPLGLVFAGTVARQQQSECKANGRVSPYPILQMKHLRRRERVSPVFTSPWS